MKTLETTDLKKWPGLDALQVRELIQCDYLTRSENLAFLGRHGTGKSHAATILGVEACRQGYRVLFSAAAQLVNTLVEAREERQLQRLLKRLDRFELLIIDELGYIPFSQEGAQLLFQVFANRLRKSLCVGDVQPGLCRMDPSLRRRGSDGSLAGSTDASLSDLCLRLGKHPADRESETTTKEPPKSRSGRPCAPCGG